MEWKIGEIFEYNGEWYQCVKSPNGTCQNCDMNFDGKCPIPIKECVANARSDLSYVIFKKLEKVGEPYKALNRLFQAYKVFTAITDVGNYDVAMIPHYETIDIELKQTKEDMEENKKTFPKEDNALTRTVYAYVNGKISDKELIRSIKEMSDEYPYNKNNLKPFSLELAKQGKPVCTRDGRKARIIAFDAKRKDEKNIIALVPSKDYPGFEDLIVYPNNGNYYGGYENDGDLMMYPEKKEGWVNVYKECDGEYYVEKVVYKIKGHAVENASSQNYVGTVRIEFYE